MHTRLILLIALSSLSILAACTSRTRMAEPSSQHVAAAEGGTVRASSHDIAIPARALGGDVEVTLATDDISGYPPLANARPDVLRIDPEGTVLEVPATVTIHPELVGASEGDRVTVAQLAPAGADAGWLFVESERDLATGGVTASVLRFAPLAIVVEPGEVVGDAARVEGTLSWGDGTPAANAPVQLFFRDAELATAETDLEGRFSFSDLEPGLYVVVVRYECDLSETVEVSTGEVARLALTLCG